MIYKLWQSCYCMFIETCRWNLAKEIMHAVLHPHLEQIVAQGTLNFMGMHAWFQRFPLQLNLLHLDRTEHNIIATNHSSVRYFLAPSKLQAYLLKLCSFTPDRSVWYPQESCMESDLLSSSTSMVLALQLKAEGGYLVLQPTQRCQIKKILKKMQKGEKKS